MSIESHKPPLLSLLHFDQRARPIAGEQPGACCGARKSPSNPILHTHLQVLKERDFPYSSMKMLASARCAHAPPLSQCRTIRVLLPSIFDDSKTIFWISTLTRAKQCNACPTGQKLRYIESNNQPSMSPAVPPTALNGCARQLQAPRLRLGKHWRLGFFWEVFSPEPSDLWTGSGCAVQVGRQEGRL